MKMKTKKILSVLLAVIMIVAAVPMTSLAAKTVASGKCGENAKWKLDSEGTLTISGTGYLYSYNYFEGPEPWEKYRKNVKKLIINEGITGSSYFTFSYCENLKSVELPKSLEDVGKIQTGVFPDIYTEAFPQNSLESIIVHKDNKYYCSVDGVLFNKDKTSLIQYPAAKSATAYKIPKTVKTIEDYAFSDCKNLKKVEIPSSVTYIGYNSFLNCKNLKSVKIPKSVKKYYYDPEFGFGYNDKNSKMSDFTVYGYKDTSAEFYAKDNGFNFIDLATHKHSYTSKVTTKATAKKAGVLTYTCKCGESYTKSISKIKSVTLSTDTYTYNGKTKQPTVTVKDSKGNTLKNGTDYTVKYSSGRKNVGKYTVTVTFKGKYSGTKKLTFKIKPKSTSISKLTAGKKQFTATWYKRTEQTSGYQLEYSTSSSMKNASRKTYTTTSKNSRTITGLKSAKKYYVRVRTYKNVKIDGKTYKYYSAWSSVKSVKTK